MELPQLPTDNLYKFMALSGIVLIGISLVPFLHTHKLSIEIIRIKGEYEILKEENFWKQIDVNSLKSDVASLKQRTKKREEDTLELRQKMSNQESKDKIKEEITKDIEDIVDETREVEDRLEKIVELQRRQNISGLLLNTKYEELEYINKAIKSEFIVCFFSFAGGLILAITGFILWYKRLQVLQDKIIQKKLGTAI